MRTAWVSVCPSAFTQAVQGFMLVKMIDAIRYGQITIWDNRNGPVDFDLAKHQNQIRQLYEEGVEEAKALNRQTNGKSSMLLGSRLARKR